jgi:hypothetical protein
MNLVGNPYASPIDIGAVLFGVGSNIGSSFYLRNPRTGSYITVNPIPASYMIPANTAVLVQAQTPTSLFFTESVKNVCTSCPTVFKTAKPKVHLQLKVIQSEEEYDNFNLSIDSQYKSSFEYALDAPKLINDGLSIYSISSDKKFLASDYRKASKSTRIPIGVQLPAAAGVQTFKIKVENCEINSNLKPILHDKLTDKTIILQNGSVYELTFDPSNPKSVGENRLEIIFENIK